MNYYSKLFVSLAFEKYLVRNLVNTLMSGWNGCDSHHLSSSSVSPRYIEAMKRAMQLL